MKRDNSLRFAIILLFITLVALSRVLVRTGSGFELLSNFSPIGAMALFGGAYFKGWKAYFFPLLALLLGDLLIAVAASPAEIFYSGWYWTYGAFALMVLVGQWLLKRVTAGNFLVSTLLVVFIHWIVTDFGVWIGGTMYPKTWAGFVECLTMAIPFERPLLYGTFVFGIIMFGAFEAFQAKFPRLRLAA